MTKYYPPQFGTPQFHCAICQVFSTQSFGTLEFQGTTAASSLSFSRCGHCNKVSYWHNKNMIIPTNSTAPGFHVDLPEICKADYNEARDIVGRSPKAAAALMRLCIQKLLKELGCIGQNINTDISDLVKKGLPVEVQQALDYCRVVGNNAVHPGEIALDDDPDIAINLFEMVNFVVEDRITRPKTIKRLYESLPTGAKEAIEKRDR